jgi:hypothetical protein
MQNVTPGGTRHPASEPKRILFKEISDLLEGMAPFLAAGAAVFTYFLGKSLGVVKGDSTFAMLSNVASKIGWVGDASGFASAFAIAVGIDGTLAAAAWILGVTKWEIQGVGYVHSWVRRRVIQRRYDEWAPMISFGSELLGSLSLAAFGSLGPDLLKSMRVGIGVPSNL